MSKKSSKKADRKAKKTAVETASEATVEETGVNADENTGDEQVIETQETAAPETVEAAPEGTSAEDGPVEEASVEEAPAEDGLVEEAPVDETSAEEAPTDDRPAEGEYSAAEGTDANLLSEFAPKPMNIPNVDLAKEKKRQEKRRKNRKKEKKRVENRKKRSGKGASAGQKVAMGIGSFFLFIILTATMAGLIAVLSVQIATSSYAFRIAVSNMDVAEISIGGVTDYERLGMKESSRKAALVDMLRDNGLDGVTVTYSEIKNGIHSSGMEKFLYTGLKSASDYLLLDKSYTSITGSDIAGVIRESATLVRNLTGRELGEEDYAEIAAYFDEGDKLDDVSLQAISSAKLRDYTPYTKNLLSLNILGALLLINIMLIVVLIILGRATGSAHISIGWGFILSGIAVILGGIFFRPSYAVTSEFLQTVLNSYFNFFTTMVVVIAGIFTVVGALIFLVGNAATDKDEDE